MSRIPEQLKDYRFRFVLLRENEKRPFEQDWQNSANYSYNQIELLKHLISKGNYGVLCGEGGLIVIDSDTKELNDIVKSMPETFTVKTGNPDPNRHHYYYFCPDCNGKKVLKKGDMHYGEIQSKGTQVVGPGSVHPTGNKYTIVKDVPIAQISYSDMKKALSSMWGTDYSNEKLVTLGIESGREISSHIIELEKTGSDKGSRDMDTWRIVKEYYNCAKTPDEILGAAKRFNEKCRPPRDMNEVERHVMQLLRHPQYLAKKITYSQIESMLVREIKRVPKPLEELQEFISTFTNMVDMAEQFYCKVPFFYDKTKSWWLWNVSEKKWDMCDETDIMISIDRALATNTDTINSKVKNEIIEAMKRVGRLHSPKEMKGTWVQCKSTVFDVKTGESFEATPEYFCTNPIPWDVGETQETPTIDAIFNEWVGEEHVQTLKEIVAYSMLPDYPISRVFCLVGAGSNGKTCFTNFIVNMIGKENTASSDLDLIMKSRFESSKLYKKLVCFIGETNFNTMSRTERLKKLTGKDAIGFEFKGKGGFDDYNYAKIIICTNSLPITNDRTRGFYRRWLIIKFPNEFTEKKDILATIPQIEYENMCRWCINSLKTILENREFTNEGTIEDREKIYEEVSNPITKFIDDNYRKDPTGRVAFSEFKDKFLLFLKRNKHRAMSGKEIGMSLSREGYEKKRFNETSIDGSKTTKVYILGVVSIDEKSIEKQVNL